ncbi:hypothetical protein FALB51S_01854 [Frigidibacter albus]
MSWRAAFAGQARACAGLGSPFTARLLQGFADRGLPEGAVERRIADWPGDISASGASVPLRLAGALHGLVLERRDAALAAVYPPAEGDELALWRAASSAILAQEDWVLSRLETAPQTNEVARSAALIVAARWLAGQTGLPMVLSELGASAGLNLIFDRYALQTPERWLGPAEANVVLAPEWRGAAATGIEPDIAARAGVDLAPRDPAADRLRLLSYVWADQPERLARIAAALDAAAALRPDLARADAVDWLEQRLAVPRPGQPAPGVPHRRLAVFPQGPARPGRGASGGGGCPRHPGCPIGALRDGGGRCRPRRGADADALARWHAEAGGPL